MRDNSEAFGDIKNDINGYFGQRHKMYNTLVFFEEMEVEINNGLLFAGATFDFLYLGRPQDWNVAD